jgi:hypothetical protein
MDVQIIQVPLERVTKLDARRCTRDQWTGNVGRISYPKFLPGGDALFVHGHSRRGADDCNSRPVTEGHRARDGAALSTLRATSSWPRDSISIDWSSSPHLSSSLKAFASRTAVSERSAAPIRARVSTSLGRRSANTRWRWSIALARARPCRCGQTATRIHGSLRKATSWCSGFSSSVAGSRCTTLPVDR